jgi:hypothetical protein
MGVHELVCTLRLHDLHNLRCAEDRQLAGLQGLNQLCPLLNDTNKGGVHVVSHGGGVRLSAPRLVTAHGEARQVEDAPHARNDREGCCRLFHSVWADVRVQLGGEDHHRQVGMETNNRVALRVLLREDDVLSPVLAGVDEVVAAEAPEHVEYKLLVLLASKNALAIVGGENGLSGAILDIATRWRPKRDQSGLLRMERNYCL